MTDLEMTWICAKAVGEVYVNRVFGPEGKTYNKPKGPPVYDPLINDAQAMALVKKFGLDIHATLDLQSRITRTDPHDGWSVESSPWGCVYRSVGGDLNRCIVECVANSVAGAVPLKRP